jgi:hypothetical protein
VARLSAPQQEAVDAVGPGRVLAAVLPARPAERLRSHPALRILCPPKMGSVAAALSGAPARRRTADGCSDVASRCPATDLDMPAVWRSDGDRREIHGRRGSIARSSTANRHDMTWSLSSRIASRRGRHCSTCVRPTRDLRVATYRGMEHRPLAHASLCFASIQRSPEPFKTHNVEKSKRLTSSRSPENSGSGWRRCARFEMDVITGGLQPFDRAAGGVLAVATVEEVSAEVVEFELVFDEVETTMSMLCATP